MILEDLASASELIGVESVNVFYCNRCGSILVSDIHQFDEQRIAFSFKKKCPECGGSLDETLRHTVYHRGHGSWVDPRIETGSLQDDSGLFDFSFGRINSTNLLEQGLSPKCKSLFILFAGRFACRQTHFEAVNAASNEERVIFLDGGNTFNVFHLRDGIENLGLKNSEHDLLERIIISRAFNFHQFTSLVVKQLSEAFKTYNPGLIIASDPTSLYEDEDVIDQREAWFSFKRMAWTLRRLARMSGIRAILNVPNPNTRAGTILKDMSDESLDYSIPNSLSRITQLIPNK